MNFVQPIRDQDVIDNIKADLRAHSMRDYLLFCMGIYSGLRVSDLLTLKVGMVRTNYISLTESKNKNKKRFIIHPAIRDDLNAYIAGKADHEYLFPSRQAKKKSKIKGKAIDRSTAYKFLRKVMNKYGVTGVGTHTLRKTWGYQLYKQDPINLALLMEMYNHDDPKDTLRYIGITQDMMDAAILKLK